MRKEKRPALLLAVSFLAGASGNRTQPAGGCPAAGGFEDREGHQVPIRSQMICQSRDERPN
jgi:hypothetical protein